MSWRDIMQRVLQPIEDAKRKWDVSPDITSPYGATTGRPPGSTNPHRGVDFVYFGKDAAKFNTSHPVLRSLVTGIVTNAGEGTMGRIAIRDANGFTHEILHTNARHVAVGDPAVAGQLIGTMGNTGTKAPHVHYQLRDPDGNVIDPSAYWDAQGPVNPNPAPPAHVGEYQNYLRNRAASDFYGFAGAPGSGDAAATLGAAAPSAQAKSIRRVTSPILDGLPQRLAAPSVQPNELPASDGAPVFNDRFGNWSASPSGSAPLNPYRVPLPPQAMAVPGIVSREPAPNDAVPPAIWGFPDASEQPGRERWSEAKLMRPVWPRR
jgi:hypothetical protein